ncbi:MAG: CsgG/HfaB family protein [Candidatus Omnitrophica bacterium]|nr:CsgG/HfaB family protein [Candidatus Omnitrophota bacterium]
MKNGFKSFGCLVLSLSIAGCLSAKHPAGIKYPQGEPFEGYSGLKAKIAVSDFELKTSGINADVGQSIKEYFIAILNSTKRFIIVAPSEADLIISVGIIEFVSENSGGKSGIAGGGSAASSFMGGLLGTPLNKATMQLNLRIVERATSNVISSRDIQSQAVENPKNKIVTPNDRAFKAGLSEYADTPIGKVIYECLLEAARYTALNVPSTYYKN